MGFTTNLIIDFYSIIILVIIYFNAARHDEKKSFSYRLFRMMLIITIISLAADMLSRFDGRPDTFYPIWNAFGNGFIFLLNPVMPSLWIIYASFQIFQDENRIRRLIYPLIILNGINLFLVIVTQFSGWYYYIDEGNIYHRGPLFFLGASFSVGQLLVALVMIMVNRKKIDKKHYFSLLFFEIPPLASLLFQTLHYGSAIAINSIVPSMLLVYLNIQNKSIYTDYLTGVHNRKMLDSYIRDKMEASVGKKTFSAVMIDLDNFKQINDTLGHDVGDRALESATKLIQSCLKPQDFIARFGGDEFFVILDMSDKEGLERIISRIKKCVQDYNDMEQEPYKLSFSMGYSVYDSTEVMEVDDFIRKVDQLMYEDKLSKTDRIK